MKRRHQGAQCLSNTAVVEVETSTVVAHTLQHTSSSTMASPNCDFEEAPFSRLETTTPWSRQDHLLQHQQQQEEEHFQQVMLHRRHQHHHQQQQQLLEGYPVSPKSEMWQSHGWSHELQQQPSQYQEPQDALPHPWSYFCARLSQDFPQQFQTSSYPTQSPPPLHHLPDSRCLEQLHPQNGGFPGPAAVFGQQHGHGSFSRLSDVFVPPVAGVEATPIISIGPIMEFRKSQAKPPYRQRAPKTITPEEKKDEKYRERREKNNDAAHRSRQRRNFRAKAINEAIGAMEEECKKLELLIEQRKAEIQLRESVLLQNGYIDLETIDRIHAQAEAEVSRMINAHAGRV